MKKVAPPDLWKKLMILGQKQGSIKLKDLALEMGLGEEETLGFLRHVFPAGVGIESHHQDNDCWIDLKGDSIQYMLPLSPGEWMQLHTILSSQKMDHNPVVISLKQKVTQNGPIKVMMELFNQLEMWDQELSDLQQKMAKEMEEAIIQKQMLNLCTVEDKFYSLIPCKVIHLDGQLSLIAEDSKDHCLLVIPLQKLKSIEVLNSGQNQKVASFEVDEFITAIRAMNEKETRLILKIHDPQSVNLFPDYHFLGKPCMVTNPSGDLIWAAYVEPCDALYEWLMTLGRNVEILDPINFKEHYLMYCEEKMRKIA